MADNLEKSGRERERYLNQIKESEEQYKTLFNYAEDSMLMVDIDGKVLAINKREEDVIGHSRNALLCKEFSSILSNEERGIFTNLFKRTLAGEKPPTAEVKVLSHERGFLTVEMDFRIKYMNEKFLKLYGREAIGKTCYEVYTGRDRPCDECPVVKGMERIGILEVNTFHGQTFLITHSPIKNLDGTTSILEIFKDITERKKLEMAIRESEEQYKSLFDYAEDSMFMADLNGKVLAANKREEDIIGHSRSVLLGQGLSSIFYKEDREAFTNLFKQILTGEKPPTAEVRVLSYKKGDILTMEMNLTGIISGEKIAFVQIHLRDITERKKLEQQLLRSERLAALAQFSSTLAPHQ